MNSALSRLHSNVVPGSLDWNVKVALVAFVKRAGAVRIVVATPVRSILQLWVAGVASVLPAASVARTWNVRAPLGSPV